MLAGLCEYSMTVDEAGRVIVVVDDDRENEGDLTMAAEKHVPRWHGIHGIDRCQSSL